MSLAPTVPAAPPSLEAIRATALRLRWWLARPFRDWFAGARLGVLVCGSNFDPVAFGKLLDDSEP